MDTIQSEELVGRLGQVTGLLTDLREGKGEEER